MLHTTDHHLYHTPVPLFLPFYATDNNHPFRRIRVGLFISRGLGHVPSPLPGRPRSRRVPHSPAGRRRATPARRDNRQCQRRPHVLPEDAPFLIFSYPTKTPAFCLIFPRDPIPHSIFFFPSSYLWICRSREVEAHSIDTHALTHARSNGCVLARVCMAFTLLFRSASFLIPNPLLSPLSFLLCTHLHREHTHGEELRRAFFTSPRFLFCITLSRAAQHLCSVLPLVGVSLGGCPFFYFRPRAHTPIKRSLNDTHFDIKRIAAFVSCLEACG